MRRRPLGLGLQNLDRNNYNYEYEVLHTRYRRVHNKCTIFQPKKCESLSLIQYPIRRLLLLIQSRRLQSYYPSPPNNSGRRRPRLPRFFPPIRCIAGCRPSGTGCPIISSNEITPFSLVRRPLLCGKSSSCTDRWLAIRWKVL